MREIKFRAWDGKVIVDLNRIDQYLDISTKYAQSTGVRGVFGFHIPKRWILMQYTGVEDENGKEIYEGDIVKHTFRAWMDSGSCGQAYYINTGEVYYDRESGSFMMKREGGGSPEFGLYVMDKMPDFGTNLKTGKKERMQPETNEVIGNIYENPELLKEVNKDG